MSCNQFFNLLDPLNDPDFVNPDYEFDPDWPDSIWLFEIYVGTQAYDYTPHVVWKSIRIENNFGYERSLLKLKIADDHPDHYNFPTQLTMEMLGILRNRLDPSKVYFRGRLKDITGDDPHIVQRADLTSVAIYSLEFQNLITCMEQELIKERYLNLTTGFIAKDTFVNHVPELDASEIDATQGRVVDDFRVPSRLAGQVIERILAMEPDWSFLYRPLNNKVYMGPKTDLSFTIPISVTDTTFYELFDRNSTLLPDTQAIKNVIEITYQGYYNVGTVDVLQGATVVFGVGTNFAGNVKEGAEFRLKGSNNIYRINSNPSTSDNLINEIHLDSPILEDDGIALEYEIFGGSFQLTVVDQQSINTMATILGQTGKNRGRFPFKVTVDGSYHTRAEAYQIGSMYLLQYSNPLIKGTLYTDTSRFDLEDVQPGQVLDVALPNTKKISMPIVIRQVVVADLGAECDSPSGNIVPLAKIELGVSSRMYELANQLRRLSFDVRKDKVADTEEFQIDFYQDEIIMVCDSIQIKSPIEGNENISVSDSIEFKPPTFIIAEMVFVSDSIDPIITIDPGPYYTVPTLRQAGRTAGRSGSAVTS